MRRIQNKVAESRRTLPVAVLYSVAVWLLAGLVQHQWWIQLALFVLSTYLMVQLNNINVLIRIFSRMVSVSFVVLTVSAVFLFPSIKGAFVQMCFIASLLTFYNSYQDKASPGWTFYTFLLLGIGSLADIHILFFVPVFWLMMLIIVYSLCWRTFFASVVGLLTPYWFWVAWMLWRQNGDLTSVMSHVLSLVNFQIPVPFSMQQTLLMALVAVLGVTGAIHFIRKSSSDKIRTRQLYYSFFIIGPYAFVLLLLQPQHYDILIRIMIIAASPLIGHFLALTNTRFTNIVFFIITIAVSILTVINLWISSFPS